MLPSGTNFDAATLLCSHCGCHRWSTWSLHSAPAFLFQGIQVVLQELQTWECVGSWK